MRTSPTLIAAAVLTAAVVGSVLNPASASASDRWALNGTFVATSNGEWATNNDVFHNEKSVRSIWTISSQCSYPTECTGTVSSDWGWTAPIYQTGGEWYVKRIIPDWMPCYDGSTAPGQQIYRFHGISADGTTSDASSGIWAGEDGTTGVAGACGRGGNLYISMPFKLVKQS
ncbi:hypothetical protein OG976_26650 [Mycobacterium sp. NBC_00419]|uniref:hypothetical protein n=1 Tax=Mycobacterium sp. NBC_00419 TaxID=2975989 RepID=UPI002E1A4EAF